MSKETYDLVNTVKDGWKTAADWMSGGPVKRLFDSKPKGEPIKFDGPKEKEEQRKANQKTTPKPAPAKKKVGGGSQSGTQIKTVKKSAPAKKYAAKR
jgi:hypothetical protein